MSDITQISYRPTPDLTQNIESRLQPARSPHDLARTAATRYYAVVDEARPDLAESEWMLLVDLLNGVWTRDPLSVRHLWANIEDAEDFYFKKHSVNRSDLLAKAKDWSFAESLSVVDYIERWWAQNGS